MPQFYADAVDRERDRHRQGEKFSKLKLGSHEDKSGMYFKNIIYIYNKKLDK